MGTDTGEVVRELFGNVLLSNRSVSLVTASPLHYQMALALFVVSQPVAKNQPIAKLPSQSNWAFIVADSDLEKANYYSRQSSFVEAGNVECKRNRTMTKVE